MGKDEKKRIEEEKERAAATKASLDGIIKDLFGYLYGQIHVSRNGVINVQFVIEEDRVSKIGYMAQGGIAYKDLPKEESKDVEPDNPV